MKKILFSILVLQIISALNIYSQQSGWVWQNPLPQGNDLFGLSMFDSQTGICINSESILRTSDGGVKWNILYTAIPSLNKSIFMVDNITGYMMVDSTTLLKTTNSGFNWYIHSEQLPCKNASLYFINVNTGFLYSTNSNLHSVKLYKTTNGGNKWNMVLSDNTFSIKKIQFINSTTGYASGTYSVNSYDYHSKLFRTTNCGQTWDSIQNTFRYQNTKIYFTNLNTGFIYGYPPVNDNKFYRTSNGGINWTPVIGSNLYSGVLHIQFLDDLNGFLLYGPYIYQTTNSGLNWIQRPIILNGDYLYYISEIFFPNVLTGFAVGSSGKIIKTTNSGINWVFLTNGYLYDQNLWEISFSDNNTGFAIGDYGKMLKTINGGLNWNLLEFDSELDFSAIAKVNSDIWYMATWWEGKILKTTNCGISWDTTYTNVYGPTRLEFINAETGFGICKYNNFIKTTNGGNNWIATSPFGSQNWAMDFIDENTGFVCGSGGKMDKTTDGGLTWIRYLPLPDEFYAADIQFINNNTGYIAAEYNVLKTTNGGIKWFTTSLITDNHIYDLFFLNENTGYAIDYNRVHKTTNGGLNWYHPKTCTTNPLNYLFFTDSLTGWAVGRNGTIIKTTTGGEPIFVEPPVEIPTRFYLFQNYPNPFNPTTTIRYGLPNKVFIKLKIYDILGRLVKELYNGEQEAGNHSLIFDGSAYASGVYFCTLETPEFTQSQKMVLLK